MNYLLTHAILNAADVHPDHPAFCCLGKELTYAQLADKMVQLAYTLREIGAQKSERVGIYMNRSLDTAIAIYGILQAGCVYVPLDPNAPATRTAYQLQDCQIRFVITHPIRSKSLQNVLKIAPAIQAIVGLKGNLSVPTISWQEVFNRPLNHAAPYQVLAQDLAYILYTSGSTGTPKGIMHTHYSGRSYAELTASTYGLQQEDRFGNHSPIHFDISTLGYFTAPSLGATTIIMPDAHTKMPASLSQLMEKERLTVWYSVPLALIQLLDLGVLEERDLSTLRWVFYAGEPFPTKYLRSLMHCWPHAQFSNIYGPAETNQCTYYNMSQPPATDDPIPLGQAWGNTDLLILNEEDEPVTTGQFGELMIRSATMMKGYWLRPDLTAKSFYTKEVMPGLVETYYRSGDLVKLDEQGVLHFLGRKDQQVKVRGYRVELGAVEHFLSNQKEVKEAIVFSYRNQKSEVFIIGVVLLHEVKQAIEKDLQLALQDQLPHYAVPQHIFLLDTFPRTGTGKIDRKGIEKHLLEKITELYG